MYILTSSDFIDSIPSSISFRIIPFQNRNITEQHRTEQNRTEQNRTEQNRTEQNRTEQGDGTGQDRTEQKSIGQYRTRDNRTSVPFIILFHCYFPFAVGLDTLSRVRLGLGQAGSGWAWSDRVGSGWVRSGWIGYTLQPLLQQIPLGGRGGERHPPTH